LLIKRGIKSKRVAHYEAMTSTEAVFQFTPAFSHSSDLVAGLVVQTKMLHERDQKTPNRVVDALLNTHYNVKRSNLSL